MPTATDNMDLLENLDSLQGLHRDLVALGEQRLTTIDRLRAELDAHLEEFRALLDKKGKNDESRRKLANEIVILDDAQYQLNDDFKQQTLQIADELDLDELQAARLLLYGQERASELDRSPIVTAIVCFHQRRQFLLESLQTALKIVKEEELEDTSTDLLQTFLSMVADFGDGRIENGAKFWIRCFTSLGDIEGWLQRLAERGQRISVLNESLSSDAMQILEFERTSLLWQHESLASIVTLTLKDYAGIPEFRKVIDRVRRLDKHDIIMVHYMPVLMRCTSFFGSEEGRLSQPEIEGLGALILAEKDDEHWQLRNLQAASTIWWFSHTTGQGVEMPPLATPSDKDSDSDRRFNRFNKALQDGALHLMLSVAQDLRYSDWLDPVKKATVDYLLQDAVKLPSDTTSPNENFRALLMSQYQDACDVVIANIPDTLRRVRAEEDDQRRNSAGRLQGNQKEYQAHLERFFMIVAYSYDHDPGRAISFWDNQDDYLYGFLQWASKRQTTPRVAAFCELLHSISQDEPCASAAHKFLLEEGTPIAGKLRRTGSLSWTQIFAELDYYATNLKDKPMAVHTRQHSSSLTLLDQLVEPESALMLECYLRLVSHLATHSSVVRSWILQHESNNLPTVLLQLAGSNIESRLRACAFATLTALLTEKTVDIAEGMWTYLDHWIAGGISPASLNNRTVVATATPAWSEQMIFDLIATGFEEPNAFVRLLSALVAPCEGEAQLNDTLPFPEALGSSYRAPGITSYVDFTLGRIFGEKSNLLTNPRDQCIMRLNCLDFMATCLSTFNEDLVVLANRSVQPVESAMRSSSLETYVRLHPFARVMEWTYNDKVLAALFAASHQDIDAVNDASSDAPLVLALTRSIQVMNLIMTLQVTYLDVVRPLLKSSADRRPPIMQATYAGFEDAVLNNLQIIVDLGLYCGTGHQDLITAALFLLEQLSSSKKLTVSPNAGFGQRSDRSRLLGILEKDNEAERISRSLISSLAVDGRELEVGPDSAGYIIKTHILRFLYKSLLASPNRPTIAHLLLGFQCGVSEISVALNGPFAQGKSLFHAVSKLLLEYRESNDETLQAWTTSLQSISMDILQLLWKAPMSCAWVMTELRAWDFLFLLAQGQQTVNNNTLWDAHTITEDVFIVTDGAISLRNFLSQRAAFLDLFSRELRVANIEGMSRLSARLSAALLGTVTFPGENSGNCPTAFDLFDFMELELPHGYSQPNEDLLRGIDFDTCMIPSPNGAVAYSLASAEELILLRRNELLNTGALFAEAEALKFDQERRDTLLFLLGNNQLEDLVTARARVLSCWVKLITLALQGCDFDAKTKSAFALQTIQMILPKLENAYSEDLSTALQLATLARTTVPHIKMAESSKAANDAHNGKDRLFQFFRTCLNGITCHIADPELRELCYLSCSQYLHSDFKSPAEKQSSRSRLLLRTVKVGGEKLTDTICDDAYSGQGNCRISALILLGELVLLANAEESKLALDAFARVNFIGVIVDSIKLIPEELSNAAPSDISQLFTTYTASLSLLQHIAQSRSGASQILAAGIFQSIRSSGLFSADPDIGFDIETPAALGNFFTLLLLLLRVITSCLLTKGIENEQTRQQALNFLTDNRQIIVGIFKRHAAVGGIRLKDGTIGEKDVDLEPLVNGFTLLISATGFLQHEDEVDGQRGPRANFS